MITPSYLSILVDLGANVDIDDELMNIRNYTIEPTGVDTITAGIVDIVRAWGQGFNGLFTLIEFETTDMTHGKEYRFTVIDNHLTVHGNGFFNGFTELFNAVSVMPVIQTIRALSQQEMEVIFSKDTDRRNLDDPSSYRFDKGLSILSVSIVSPRVIRLRTSRQVSSELYTLTVL